MLLSGKSKMASEMEENVDPGRKMKRPHVRWSVVLETNVPLVKLVTPRLRQFLTHTFVTSRFRKYGVLFPYDKMCCDDPLGGHVIVHF